MIKPNRQSASKLEVTEASEIAIVRREFGYRGFLPENINRSLFIYVFVVLGLVLVFYKAANPLSQWLAHKVPFAYEKKLASSLLDTKSEKAFTTCKDKVAQSVLQALANRFVASAQNSVFVEVLVIPDKQVNAFALPGGYIIFTRAIIEKAENPDEIAGVLAHEVQHVVKRHVVAQLIRSSLMMAVWNVAIGDLSSILVLDPSTFYSVATRKFSREAEREADIGAAQMLIRDHISTVGMSKFLARLSKDMSFVPQFLVTHPTRERLASEYLPQNPSGDRLHSALTAEQWQALKGACKD